MVKNTYSKIYLRISVMKFWPKTFFFVKRNIYKFNFKISIFPMSEYKALLIKDVHVV